MSLLKGFFRCPYHLIARKEKAILEVKLTDDRTERLENMQKGFNDFYANPKLSVMQLTLPSSLQTTCTSLAELKKEMIPYLCELLAAELSVRLYPILPFQIKTVPIEKVREAIAINPMLSKIATSIVSAIHVTKFGMVTSVGHLAEFLEKFLTGIYNNGIPNPSLKLEDLVHIMLGSILFPHELRREVAYDPTKNRNCFSFVTAPFYPKEFGRYSKKITIVTTRQSDIMSIKPGSHLEIRRQNNTLLKEHGVVIRDIDNEKQNAGVWIPEYQRTQTV